MKSRETMTIESFSSVLAWQENVMALKAKTCRYLNLLLFYLIIKPDKYVLPDFSGLVSRFDAQIRKQFIQQKKMNIIVVTDSFLTDGVRLVLSVINITAANDLRR
ncbi:hypothetical protein TMSI_57490 (plasmid) [Klebsiella quasipneumoniae]|uniref:hypothetical protein n=1 Tax=Klebsiella quasipneumoniae TaxID=1463165 RepID=UPI00125A6FAF|nr:hypothetical protein [Klebsiella quasipneumoniae]BBK15357.1 hypothetical protein TMSI_57490 [Klebsiella quasipneumoniae]